MEETCIFPCALHNQKRALIFTRPLAEAAMNLVPCWIIFTSNTRVRINHAKELIEATHLPFGEIGYLTGLDDPYYFSKVFKKYVGATPSQYYKERRERKARS